MDFQTKKHGIDYSKKFFDNSLRRISMDIKQAFLVLRERLGPDKACAEYVRMTPQHYEALRNGRAPIPERTAELIIQKAEKLSSCQGAAPPAGPAFDARV